MSRRIRGFTLIELLVVVAIIALLIAILIPSLSRAREQAKTVQCATNMRSTGQILNVYAAQHDGRGPGEADTHDSSNPSQPIDWGDILNNDMFDLNTGGNNTPNGYIYGNPAMFYGSLELQTPATFPGYIHGKRIMICPNYVCLNDYDRCYSINRCATGGGGYSIPGAYGMIADPRSANRNPTLYYDFAYGAKLDRFRPDQILLVDTQYDFWFPRYNPAASFDATHGRNLVGGVCVLNDTPGFPNYESHAGEIAFRHPYGKKGNFLFFDDHVDTLTPKDNIDTDNKFFIDGNYVAESATGQ